MRRLDVEIYERPPARPRTRLSKDSQRAVARDPQIGAEKRRAFVAIVVVALHAGVLAWAISGRSGEATPHRPPPPLVLMKLAILREKMPLAELAASLPAPVEETPRLSTLLPAFPTSDKLTLAVGPDVDAVISDADATEIFNVARRCVSKNWRPGIISGVAITLLALVEMDGEVSDSKIAVDNGARLAAEAAQRCLLTYGRFAPRRLKGEAVPSWQRVRWPAAVW